MQSELAGWPEVGVLQRDTRVETGPAQSRSDDMVWIPGGEFRMPRDRGRGQPPAMIRACVSGFWMDRAPVTVRQFAAFVAATGRTASAAVRDCLPDDGPAVHVTYQDAEAYAAWAHKALPTAAECEFAAQGRYGLCAITDGFWEWTADWHVPPATRPLPELCCAERVSADETGLGPPDLLVPGKVLWAASGLCARSSGADHPGTTLSRPLDFSAGHVGFRCVAAASALKVRSACS
jgi:formylglycine-generating enzyme